MRSRAPSSDCRLRLVQFGRRRGRAKRWPVRVARRRWSAPKLMGPRRMRSARSASASPASSKNGDVLTRASSQQNAEASVPEAAQGERQQARAEGASSHWVSSIARSDRAICGPLPRRPWSAPPRPRPGRSTARPGVRSSAAARASRCGRRQPIQVLVRHPADQVERSATNESACSTAAGAHVSTSIDRPRARPIAALQSIDLPTPASPSMRRPDQPDPCRRSPQRESGQQPGAPIARPTMSGPGGAVRSSAVTRQR